MHAALSLLIELDPPDVEWLLRTGGEQSVRRGDIVLRAGELPDHVFVVLEGVVDIHLGADDLPPVAHLGPGELLGEISFLEDGAASATVRAAEDGILLAVPRAAIEERIGRDPAFGSRLYRGLGRVVSRRLREREAAARVPGAAAGTVDAASAALGAHLGPAVREFKALMQEADEEARRGDGAVPDATAERAACDLDALCALLNETLGVDSDRDAGAAASAELRREMRPYMMLTRLVERIYTKPRGYAGDFRTIEWIYRDEPGGKGSLGPLLDRLFLARPAARAVRNRRALLADAIRDAVDRGGRVTSLACGPAEELFDVFGELEDPGRLRSTLIDIDLEALAFVSERRERARLAGHMELLQANLVYLATGRQQLELEDQDLVYSIGLIDYFQDRFVVALLDWIHGRLRPGGRVVLGNFHPRNPDRGLMDHVLDWKLIHRTEHDLHRLFSASRFGAPCDEILYEPERVNLFAVGVRAE